MRRLFGLQNEKPFQKVDIVPIVLRAQNGRGPMRREQKEAHTAIGVTDKEGAALPQRIEQVTDKGARNPALADKGEGKDPFLLRQTKG